jgi:hypothetical protein
MSQTDYLNAMGISTWVLKDAELVTEPMVDASASDAQVVDSSGAETLPVSQMASSPLPKAAPVQPLAMDPAYAHAWTFVMDQYMRNLGGWGSEGEIGLCAPTCIRRTYKLL